MEAPLLEESKMLNDLSSPALSEYLQAKSGRKPIHECMLNGFPLSCYRLRHIHQIVCLMEKLQFARALNHSFPMLPCFVRRLAKRQCQINDVLTDVGLRISRMVPNCSNLLFSESVEVLISLNGKSRILRKQARINRLIIDSYENTIEAWRSSRLRSVKAVHSDQNIDSRLLVLQTENKRWRIVRNQFLINETLIEVLLPKEISPNL